MSRVARMGSTEIPAQRTIGLCPQRRQRHSSRQRTVLPSRTIKIHLHRIWNARRRAVWREAGFSGLLPKALQQFRDRGLPAPHWLELSRIQIKAFLVVAHREIPCRSGRFAFARLSRVRARDLESPVLHEVEIGVSAAGLSAGRKALAAVRDQLRVSA
jgi:hypothetical protein